MDRTGKTRPTHTTDEPAPASHPDPSQSSHAQGDTGWKWVLLLVDVWWRARWNILSLVTVGTLAWIGVLFLVPNQYRAESRVIVLPPKFLPEVRTEPLSVATANELLSSASILEQVIEMMRLGRQAGNLAMARDIQPVKWASAPPAKIERDIRNLMGEGLPINDSQTSALSQLLSRLTVPELEYLMAMDEDILNDWTVDDLGRALSNSTTVDQRTAVDIKLSPLLKLTATADHPRLAQLLANAWAMVFEQAYDSLSTSKTRRQYESILNQQRLSVQELDQAQTDLVSFKARHNLELYLRQIEQYSEDFRDQSRQLLAKQNALRAQSGQLDQLLIMSDLLQKDGSWIGSVGDRMGLEADSLSLPSENEANRTTAGTARQLALQTIRTRDQLRQAILDFDHFYEKYPVELLQSTRDQLKTEYLDGSSRLRSGNLRIQQYQATFQALESRVRQTTPTVALNLTPSPDGLAFLSNAPGAPANGEGRLNFEQEEMNPLWLKLTEAMAVTITSLEQATAEVAQLTPDIPQREIEYRALQTTVTKAQLTSELVRDNLDRWKRAHEELFSSYVALTNDTFNTARNLALVEEDVKNLVEATSQTRAMVDSLQKTYNEASAQQAVLESRLRAVQRRAELLFQKLQDAQTAVAEEVSDVTVASRAVLPGRHYFPRRSLLLPALVMLTGLMALAYVTYQRRDQFSRL